MQLLLPAARIFLDVDDLESVDALEDYVRQSAAVLILLGSPKYWLSPNCAWNRVESRRVHGVLSHIFITVGFKQVCARSQQQSRLGRP